MKAEKGATPSRRLPSRSGRASFDGNTAGERDHRHNGEIVPAGQAAARAGETLEAQERELPSSEDSSSSGSNGASRAERNSAGQPAKQGAAPVTVTPRGRGRPRKKPLEPPPPSVQAEEANIEAAATADAAAAAVSTARADGSSAASSPRSGGSSPRAVGGWETARTVVATKKGKEGGVADGGGNDSDEWSDNDEVHDLPEEIKAQFGQVRRGSTGSQSTV